MRRLRDILQESRGPRKDQPAKITKVKNLLAQGKGHGHISQELGISKVASRVFVHKNKAKLGLKPGKGVKWTQTGHQLKRLLGVNEEKFIPLVPGVEGINFSSSSEVSEKDNLKEHWLAGILSPNRQLMLNDIAGKK